MTEQNNYDYKKKVKNPDDKFKEFAYLIKECKICKGLGFKPNYPKDAKGLSIPGVKAKECSCIKKAYYFSLYKEANIPSEYWTLNYKNFIKKDENLKVIEIMDKVLLDIKEFNKSGLGLLFYGSQGTGKSLLAVEVLKKALRNGLSGRYEWFPLIMETFKEKGFTGDIKKESYNDIFAKNDVLIIDEIGKESLDKYNLTKHDVARILEINILKRRSSNTTILISNIENVEDFKNQYGTFVDSVINQRFKKINLTGTDFRTPILVNQFFGEE